MALPKRPRKRNCEPSGKGLYKCVREGLALATWSLWLQSRRDRQAPSGRRNGVSQWRVWDSEVGPSLKAREGEAGVIDGVILAAAQARLKALQLLRLQEAVLVDVQHAVQQIDLVWPDLRTMPHT